MCSKDFSVYFSTQHGVLAYISYRSNAEITHSRPCPTLADFHGHDAKSRRYPKIMHGTYTTKITVKATVIVIT